MPDSTSSGGCVFQNMQRRHHHAIGGRAADGEMALIDFAQAQRHGQGQGMRCAGLFGLRRHHPDIIGDGAGDLFRHAKPRGMDAIVIGDKNAHQTLLIWVLPPM